MTDYCEDSNETSGSIKCGEFLGYLRNYLLIKNDTFSLSSYRANIKICGCGSAASEESWNSCGLYAFVETSRLFFSNVNAGKIGTMQHVSSGIASGFHSGGTSFESRLVHRSS